MNIPGPACRYHTPEAFVAIVQKFKWPYKDWMQDWPLEVWEHIDLDFCLQEYPQLVDDDEKFLLMKGMLYALDEVQGEDFKQLSKSVAELLSADFDTHQSTVYYWTLYGTDMEDGFTITPLMREIWDARLK